MKDSNVKFEEVRRILKGQYETEKFNVAKERSRLGYMIKDQNQLSNDKNKNLNDEERDK